LKGFDESVIYTENVWLLSQILTRTWSWYKVDLFLSSGEKVGRTLLI